MADPTPYEIEYDFPGFQSSNPSTPLPAPALQNELENIQTSVEEQRLALMEIRQSDGGLKNGIVEERNLSSGLTIGLVAASKWATAHAYAVNQTVFFGAKYYTCRIAHTSGTFATDLAAVKWALLADFTPAGVVAAESVTYDNSSSGLTADDVQAALDEVAGRVDDLESGSIDLADLSAPVTLRLLPVGAMTAYGGLVAPDGWLLCYGQAISRSTYSLLYAAIGDNYGNGDGTTTFNVPDKRGRVSAGKDDMGGTSANRLTNFSGGIDGDAMAGVGGSEKHALTSAQLAAHSHTATAAVAGSHRHFVVGADSGNTTPSASNQIGVDSGNTSDNVDYNLRGRATEATLGRTSAVADHTHVLTVANAGSSTAHNNVQPTQIDSWIIFAAV